MTSEARAGAAGGAIAPAVLLLSVAVTGLLVGVSARYGYHRDELYFLVAGRHLAWGYPDQPPFVALVARVVDDLAPRSLVLLRLPAAIATGLIVLTTGAIARELGGDRAAQTLSAAAIGVAAVVLGAGHQMGTTVFTFLAWAVLLLLVLRVLRTGNERLWPVIGVGAGVGLLDSTLVAFLLVAIGIGVLLVGPRRLLLSPWLWAGVVIAVALWLPYLDWQARHGWPQLAESRAIAAGKSGSSQPRAAFLPFQLLLTSPWLTPIWIAGLVRLWRDTTLRWCRALVPAYVVLVVVFIATGGKPYYLAGFYPVLLAAGAGPTLRWMRRSSRRAVAVGLAFALSLPAMLIALPILPQDALVRAHAVDVNYDLGEQVGWPAYVGQVAAAYDGLRAPGAPIVTSNYGEAGALDRYGGRYRLPHAYSGQTGFWYWGPPPERTGPVLAIGFDRSFLVTVFDDVQLVGRLHNRYGLANDEQGAPLWRCDGRKGSWRLLWPRFKST